MARVNRTTGFFLVLGVIALLGTVSGGLMVQNGGGDGNTVQIKTTADSIAAAGNFDVDSGVRNLVPRILAGRVKAVLVKEGEPVTAGQPLVQLDDQKARDELRIAEQELVENGAKLQAARDTADRLVKEHELKVTHAQSTVDTALVIYESAQKKRTRAQEYYDKRTDAAAENLLQDADSALLIAKTQWLAATKALNQLKSIDMKVSMAAEEEALKTAELRVAAGKAEIDAFVIRAPSDGKIMKINYQIGGSAPLMMGDPNASQALLFCPKEGLVVRAEIDQEWALFVKAGQKATVTLQSGDHELTWTGTVDRVADYMSRRRSGTLDPSSFSDGVTRECVIRIDPSSNPHVHNLKVQVKIHLEK